ncbi:hypothetical protein XM38_019170 [Halomicronema hongdechloris C2206]|uniref:Uncharacterized protein n=1 Tax=Halomicronema hongdechloris C2206 TaxID=1641165 RepID=A0A1Z3HKZ0_9CYAN|nr:hypothetical protein XM38_019170 [Halomicronema hongdechloris C2206]
MATPQVLRRQQGLAEPTWTSGEDATPIEPPLLWGFMPLEDGWAQVPVPNLSEQIYLDSRVAGSLATAAETSPLLQGAVALGNDHPQVLSRYRQEQPWNLTLTNAAHLDGTWTLASTAAGLELRRIALTLEQPEITLNGLFWLSTGKPRRQDALPDLEDWIAGVRSHPLRTLAPDGGIFPPVLTLTLDTLELSRRSAAEERSSAQLQGWQFTYAVDTTERTWILEDDTERLRLPCCSGWWTRECCRRIASVATAP